MRSTCSAGSGSRTSHDHRRACRCAVPGCAVSAVRPGADVRATRRSAMSAMTFVDRTAVAGLCHWHANVADTQAATSHLAYHYGSPCPYGVVADVLLGLPDPRDAVAEWRIALPFAKGKPPLSLNDRHSPFAHAAIVNKIKAIVRNAVREAAVPELGYVHVEMHYRPAINRIR